jgi:hypothetical protein
MHPATVAADHSSSRVELLDDCDPRVAAGWNTPTDRTGCIRRDGSVTRAEFMALLLSPLSQSVVGHPSWTISPTYLVADANERIRVRNAGGRGHTFTKVAQFGGGFVAPLNVGLTPAPECAAAAGQVIEPGGRAIVSGLAVGENRFMCCIHPWMRAVVQVEEDDHGDDD